MSNFSFNKTPTNPLGTGFGFGQNVGLGTNQQQPGGSNLGMNMGGGLTNQPGTGLGGQGTVSNIFSGGQQPGQMFGQQGQQGQQGLTTGFGGQTGQSGQMFGQQGQQGQQGLTSGFGGQQGQTGQIFGQQGQQGQQGLTSGFGGQQGQTGQMFGQQKPLQTGQFGQTGQPQFGFGTSQTGTGGLSLGQISSKSTTLPSASFNLGGVGTSQTSGMSNIGMNKPQTTQPFLTSTTHIHSQMPSSSNILGIPTSFQGQSSLNQGKKQEDLNEILNVMQNYYNSLSPNSHMNMFKHMLYNRVPKDNENMIQLFQTFREKIIGEDGKEVQIDYNAWVKALQTNPNPYFYYPTQVSSPEALVHRAKTTETFLFASLETILSLQSNLSQVNDLYDNDIDQKANGIKKKLETIKNKHLLLNVKIEKLAQLTGKAEKNYPMENLLVNKLNKIKAEINERENYKGKIKEISQMINSMGIEPSTNEEKDYFKDFDPQRLEKNVETLTDMKKIFDVTMKSLRQNSAVISGIRNDLETLKKYGKVPK